MNRKSWKDELPPLILAIAAQFAVLRVIDWAQGASETNDLANQLVSNRFYFAPQLLGLVIVVLLVRIVRHALDFRGMRLSDWIRSSILFLLLGCAVLVAAHADQLLSFAVRLFPADILVAGKRALQRLGLYVALQKNATLRWGVDLAGLLICLLGFRSGTPETSESQAARDMALAGDWIRSGELYLKKGNLKKAKAAFRKANAPLRVAGLELREGKPKAAAALYEEAGEAYTWEASKAWLAASDPARAEATRKRAVVEARANSRWDRLAEIAEATGDQAALGEATRRLAELKPPGPARTALWKRAADAFRSSRNVLEAAESYRAASEFLPAAELFLEAGQPAEAARDFERAGELARAASAAAGAGDIRMSQELTARHAEFRGDLAAAAEAWCAVGLHDRAAALFERQGLFAKAASCWRDARRPENSAPLFLKAGDKKGAAEAFESAGKPDKAGALYSEIGNFDKAAELFRGAGRMAEAADALRSGGRVEEASVLFQRAGRGLDAARCELSAGHREKAWEHITTVPRTEPGLKEFFLELAQAHLQSDEPRDAVYVLRQLLGPSSVDAQNIGAHAALAYALERAGEHDEAGQRVARIRAFDPGYPIAVAQPGAAPQPAAAPRPATGTHSRFEPAPSSNPPAPPAPSPAQETSSISSLEALNFAPTLTPFPSAEFPAPPLSSAPLRSPSGVIPIQNPSVSVGSSGSFPNVNAPELRYEIISELGRGGMGVVHKALDRKLDRHVALKILPWQLQGDETAKRYFEREAKAIAALKHPNIVALYDYGEGFGSLYLAMEYLEGPNLQSLLRSDPELVKRKWRTWFVQSTRGVAAAHAKGLLHRDLKPANLMLDEHQTLRILDFGLARSEADSGATSKLIGTPAFFPPEVLRGEMPTPASDVYSLGATFYTLATGRWPYVGDDVLIARLEREPDDPRPFAPQLSEDEVAILMRALARHRPERYPDAGELLGDLLALEV